MLESDQKVAQPARRLNFVDLFAGVGGFTLGFLDSASERRCEFVPRLLVDIDRSARNVFVRNMPRVPYLNVDMHQISGAEIKRRSGISNDERLDVLIGGPPCQGFSFLGKRALDDDRNVHIVDYLRLVKELRPLVAVMENVPLVITNYDGAVIKEVCAALSEFGYSSCADVLTASEYGVPQIRKRAFVLAYHKDLGVAPELPKRTHERVPTASELVEARKRTRFEADKLPYVSVEDAIGDLPQIKAGEGEEMMTYPKREVPLTGFQAWAREGSPVAFNHRSRTHSAAYLKKISIIEEGGRNMELPEDQRFSDNYYSQAYARLHRNGLANTITTSFGNPGSGRFLHYRELRSITVREAARLQSFPDRFVFDGDHVAQMRHVGNAVPPLLARAVRDQIARDILESSNATKTTLRVPPPAGANARRPEDPEQRSRTMRAVPSKDTSAEKALRRILSDAGIKGYRLHCSDLPGNPDVVFRKQKLTIFVDGCFWHGCQKCRRRPSSNQPYWNMKVQRNRDRDALVNKECKKRGWRVLRVWEHEVLRHASRVEARVKRELERSRQPSSRARKHA
ncbi:MAG TPA: DNA mismatch endonuclease Vsr [Tepidisphaeraceae bacterium]|jgi:DNA (cytosine-5)-methyltransferase 1